jgi:methionyl aminopeptidase
MGKVIEDTINKRGFTPIYDLTGHSLDQYSLHGNVNIPNYAASLGNTLLAGDVIAIEPSQIFSLNKLFEKHIHDKYNTNSDTHSNGLLDDLYRQYGSLPFARRWVKDMDGVKIENYVATGDIIAYPVLHEISGGIVSQFEHTVIVEESGCIVTT